MKVTSFAMYLSGPPGGWRDEDFSANFFIKAIKGEQLKGYGTVPVRNHSHRLDNTNLAKAKEWFAQRAADHLVQVHGDSLKGLAIVPFPNRSAIVGTSSQPSASFDLANALDTELMMQGHITTLADILRWTERRPAARDEKGPRDPGQVYPYLTVEAKKLPKRCLLLDDVVTSGSRLQSAEAIFKAKGVQVIGAVVAGRTVHVQHDDPFAVVDHEFPFYDPDSDEIW